jgi:thymidylate synthase (FAD)
MKIVQPSAKILTTEDPIDILKRVERCARLCYKSEGKITSDSYEKFLKGVIKRGHLSVIEHGVITMLVVCDRGVSHEIVRHRIGSYSQESTRYVNYKDEMEFIEPCFWAEGPISIAKLEIWKAAMSDAEKRYQALIGLFATPEQARSILPNSLKTEIAITYNLREWLHFLDLRCSKASHPQMRQVALLILEKLYEFMPVIFGDLMEKYEI